MHTNTHPSQQPNNMRYLLTNRAWHTQTYSESPSVPWNTTPARQTRSAQLPLTHYCKQQVHGWISVNKLWYSLVFVRFECDYPKMSCIYSDMKLRSHLFSNQYFFLISLRCDKLLFIDPFKNVIYLAIYLCVCACVSVGVG